MQFKIQPLHVMEKEMALQYSCLENAMDRGAWQATAHGAAELATTERSTWRKRNSPTLLVGASWYSHYRKQHGASLEN